MPILTNQPASQLTNWAQKDEKSFQKPFNTQQLFFIFTLHWFSAEEQEYTGNDRDSRNALRCHWDTETLYLGPRWSTGDLQRHFYNTGKSLQVINLKTCDFMFFMLLGLNKETDPAKLSLVKRHKYLISILWHVYEKKICIRNYQKENNTTQRYHFSWSQEETHGSSFIWAHLSKHVNINLLFLRDLYTSLSNI